MVTLVGPGGIGKTTVALVAAASFAERSVLPCHFVDLATLSDPALVASALAQSLGVSGPTADTPSAMKRYLRDKRRLIVFDNCEHVVGDVAALVEDILREAPEVRILATSREPLRAESEWVQRLHPLTTPPNGRGLSAKTALTYAAIELFVERVVESNASFELSDSDVEAVAEICGKLDGIPLALELAAARIELLGIAGLASALDDRLSVLSSGRRTATPRHQTLRATLGWSFDTLSERDKLLLVRLSVFSGSFDLPSAMTVAATDGLAPVDVVEGLHDLVAKSLLITDASTGVIAYRLLESVRTYAAERLDALGQTAAMRARHAQFVVSMLATADAEWPVTDTAQWISRYGRKIDEVRFALRWAMGPGGDLSVAATVSAKSAPLLFQLSLSDEHRVHCERALSALADSGTSIPPELEFHLNIVLGHSIFNTQGSQPAIAELFDRALRIAQQSGDKNLLAYAYSTLWMGAFQSGDPPTMLVHAEKFRTLQSPSTDPTLQIMLDRMYAPALHLNGDQAGARRCAERSLAAAVHIRPALQSGAQIDRRVSVGSILARVQWLQGFSDQADRTARQALEIASNEGEGVALGYLLGFSACPVALWSGRTDVAWERVNWLLRHADAYNLRSWQRYGLAFEQLLLAEGNEEEARDRLERLAQVIEFPPQLGELIATICPAAASPATLRRGRKGLAPWCALELRRIEAMATCDADPDAAMTELVAIATAARSQGTLSWELRAAASLAQVAVGTPNGMSARKLLCDVLDRFTECLGTPDVVKGRQQMELLSTF